VPCRLVRGTILLVLRLILPLIVARLGMVLSRPVQRLPQKGERNVLLFFQVPSAGQMQGACSLQHLLHRLRRVAPYARDYLGDAL